MTEALYEDAGLRLDEDGITIRHVGRLVRPCITPEIPERIIEVLRDRVRPS
ncbi:MAG TPA: hypothetical protein VGF65_07795 [Mycobacterium sp.]